MAKAFDLVSRIPRAGEAKHGPSAVKPKAIHLVIITGTDDLLLKPHLPEVAQSLMHSGLVRSDSSVPAKAEEAR
jgi:hypothetical protein